MHAREGIETAGEGGEEVAGTRKRKHLECRNVETMLETNAEPWILGHQLEKA